MKKIKESIMSSFFNVPALPSAEEIKNALTIAAVAAGVIVVAKIVSGISKKVHEKQQDKDIKKLNTQVQELQTRLANLEKA